MEYSMDIRVRYSECAHDGTAAIHQILNYFQDSAIFQSESIGYGISRNLADHQAWFLLAYDLSIERKPRMFEKVSVVTEPYKMKGHYGYRHFYIRNEDGETLVKADSIWILMDSDSLLPVKVPEDMIKAYLPDAPDDKVRIKRKIPVAKEGWEECTRFIITQMYLDTNHHVNNNYYALWAENLMNRETPTRMRIDYRKAAVLGDQVTASCQKKCGKTLCSDLENVEKPTSIVMRYINQDDELLAYVSMEWEEKGEKE